MSDQHALRILFWNIMHGGGGRAGKIVEQINEWNPDIVALAEFRGTSPSKSISKSLLDAGYIHQLSTVNADQPTWNALFLASRFELTRMYIEGAPEPDYLWLLARAETDPAIHIGVAHVPLMTKTSKWGWLEYYRALLKITEEWQLGPGSIVGDMNSGLSGLDEETAYSQDYKDTFMNPMQARGWRDMFRVFHPQADAPTWYSPSQNGFRLDQAFANPQLSAQVVSCAYDWGRVGEHGKMSDHAALLLDLALAQEGPLI